MSVSGSDSGGTHGGYGASSATQLLLVAVMQLSELHCIIEKLVLHLSEQFLVTCKVVKVDSYLNFFISNF